MPFATKSQIQVSISKGPRLERNLRLGRQNHVIILQESTINPSTKKKQKMLAKKETQGERAEQSKNKNVMESELITCQSAQVRRPDPKTGATKTIHPPPTHPSRSAVKIKEGKTRCVSEKDSSAGERRAAKKDEETCGTQGRNRLLPAELRRGRATSAVGRP